MQIVNLLILAFATFLYLRRSDHLLLFPVGLSLMGSCGNVVWEWARLAERPWAGLPITVSLSADQAALGSLMFAVAAASSLACITVLPASERPGAIHLDSRLLTGIHIANIVAIVSWFAGHGPSAFWREEYLDTNGVIALYRAVSVFVVPILVMNAFVILRSKTTLPVSILVYQLGWLFLLSAVGTRVAVIAGFITAGCLLCNMKLWKIAFPLGLAFLSLGASAAEFIHYARGNVHGILPLAQRLATGEHLLFAGPLGVVEVVRSMASSIFATFPITVLAAESALEAGAMVAYTNPLPRFLLGEDNISYLSINHFRILPWVPMSSTGMLYAVAGLWGIVALWSSTTILFVAQRKLMREISLSSAFIAGGALLVLVSSFQYDTRAHMRLVLTLLAVSVFAWCALRLRDILSEARSGRVVARQEVRTPGTVSHAQVSPHGGQTVSGSDNSQLVLRRLLRSALSRAGLLTSPCAVGVSGQGTTQGSRVMWAKHDS